MLLKRSLGSEGAEVAAIGLGTFSFSHAYGRADATESRRTLDRALELGCTLLDTADSYGGGENERWLGEMLVGRRDAVVLGTKVGLVCDSSGKVVERNGTPEYLGKAIDASLQRLRTDALDLCTLHRVDPRIPIEESVGALAEAVTAGKVRSIGLSEVTSTELLRAQAVHPIAAVQCEYSLWTREPECELIPLTARLGLAFLAFSPLGRGLFAASPGSIALEQGDFRGSLPRFQGENFQRNTELAAAVHTLAGRKNGTSSQVALAWVLQASPNMFAIPGTRTVKHLEENFGALDIELTKSEREELDRVFAPQNIAGERYAEDSIFAPTRDS